MKRFPIMWAEGRREFGTREEARCPDSIPWDLIAPHEEQAEENHDQDLAMLASRGGLDPFEAVAVLTDRTWREVMKGRPPISKISRDDLMEAVAELLELIGRSTTND